MRNSSEEEERKRPIKDIFSEAYRFQVLQKGIARVSIKFKQIKNNNALKKVKIRK